jgi:hypothetical protein
MRGLTRLTIASRGFAVLVLAALLVGFSAGCGAGTPATGNVGTSVWDNRPVRPSGEVVGYVVTSDGHPIHRAYIEADPLDAHGTVGLIAVFTNSAGRYFQAGLLSPAPYRLVVSAPGYREAEKRVEMKAGVRSIVNFELERESARADQPRSQTAVPPDVRANLRTDYGITVAAPPRGASPSVAVGQARSRAVREYGDLGGHPASAHLVLYSDPEFGDAPSELAAGEDDVVITPAHMNHLAWLVVVRGATPALHGPPGGTYDATVAVFIDAKTGGELTEVTLPPR